MTAPAASFSDAWLALREGADHRARSVAIEAMLAGALAGRESVRVVDLGAGTGSNLRALAPRLGPRQHWTLLDHDASLMVVARERLAAAADAAHMEGETQVLSLAGNLVRVDFAIADLASDPGAPRAFAPDLVTASALFDLVSANWCARFARALNGSGIVVHAALTCDGRDAWHPPHPSDAAIAAAFRVHQSMDKGFGPAAGSDAGAILAAALDCAGYDVTLADSPWRLGPADLALMAQLAAGTAAAAAETGLVDAAAAAAWETARRKADGCIIGHMDLLALPRR